jgi:DNA-binding XRE family transcriptional regulator
MTNETPSKKQWAWLTEKHFAQLQKYNDDLHFDPVNLEKWIPYVGPIEECLYLAIYRDGRPRKVIAQDIGIHHTTIVNVTKRHYKPKLGVAKKILAYCAKFNVKVLLMKSI